jgi:hypothetical protein
VTPLFKLAIRVSWQTKTLSEITLASRSLMVVQLAWSAVR